MKIRNVYAPLLLVPLLFGTALPAQAQGGWFGGGEEAPRPSLLLRPSEITFTGPTPMDGQNLQLLLALPESLGELRKQAAAQFSAHLQGELQSRLAEVFSDEDIPLVTTGGELVFRSTVNLSIRQQIREVKKFDRYDTERGTLKVYGSFSYALRNQRGTLLDEQQLDLAGLGVERRYVTRTPRGSDAVEDSTGPAIEKLLGDIAEELVDAIEDRLEAGKLQQLAMKNPSP